MRCLLLYDISNDGIRYKIADACLDYGLDRIQYSAFFGELERCYQKEMMKKMRRILGKEGGNIQLFPLCQNDWDKRDVIIQEGKNGKS